MDIENLTPPEQSASPSPPITESRAREYLSNERTYLSWMRTAISLMGLGVILVRVRSAQSAPVASLMLRAETTWKVGLVLSIIGIVTVFLATQHYFAIRQEIADDDYEPTGRWVILLSLAVLLVGAGLIYYVFSYAPLSLPTEME